MSSTARISPTAHYTGYVWARNGLSHPALQTLEGRLLFESLRGVNALNALVAGQSLERYLLARHRSLDLLLERAIEQEEVSQVIEVACGLSPRGWRFAARYGNGIDYVEADLPDMAARKREALGRIGTLGDHHRVVEIDALAEHGASSLSGLARELDPARGTAIVTEGLTGYLDGGSLAAMWRRFATTLAGFRTGIYLTDLHLGEVQNAQIRAFRLALSVFVRGAVHLHFENAGEARAALEEAGFATAEVMRAASLIGTERDRGEGLVHIIEASAPRSR
jgi:O-methyltransferase involved in polyketide biosynthesis